MKLWQQRKNKKNCESSIGSCARPCVWRMHVRVRVRQSRKWNRSSVFFQPGAVVTPPPPPLPKKKKRKMNYTHLTYDQCHREETKEWGSRTWPQSNTGHLCHSDSVSQNLSTHNPSTCISRRNLQDRKKKTTHYFDPHHGGDTDRRLKFWLSSLGNHRCVRPSTQPWDPGHLIIVRQLLVTSTYSTSASTSKFVRALSMEYHTLMWLSLTFLARRFDLSLQVFPRKESEWQADNRINFMF